MRAPMASQYRKRRFTVSNPGAELSRQEAMQLVQRLLDDDQQIDHDQPDLFRDTPDDAATDAQLPRNFSHWIERIWHSLTRGL